MKLYTFRINPNWNEGTGDQSNLRKGIISLLEIAPIGFRMYREDEENKLEIKKQEFTFETQEEARIFALKILKTNVIFFCELYSSEVQK